MAEVRRRHECAPPSWRRSTAKTPQPTKGLMTSGRADRQRPCDIELLCSTTSLLALKADGSLFRRQAQPPYFLRGRPHFSTPMHYRAHTATYAVSATPAIIAAATLFARFQCLPFHSRDAACHVRLVCRSRLSHDIIFDDYFYDIFHIILSWPVIIDHYISFL